MPLRLRLAVPRRRYWMVAAILVFVACAVAGLIAFEPGRRGPRSKFDQGGPAFDRLYLRGVVHTSYRHGEKLFTLRADEIVHRKRKVGPLTLNPIKEVEMNGVRIEIHQVTRVARGDSPLVEDVALPIQPILEETLSAKGLGFVSRVIMNRFDLAVLSGEERQFSIKASTAFAGLGSPFLRLEGGVTLSTRRKEQVITRRAEWRSDTRRLFVRGSYVLSDEHGSHPGERASFAFGADGRITMD